MHKKNKNVWLLSLALLLSACDKPVETVKVVRPLLVMKVGAQATESKGLVLTGEVKARYQSDVGFRIPGKIMKRYVEVGQAVKKGQLIATIDARDSNLNASAARADVRAAEANHHLAEVELERKKQLHAKKFISKSALDTQIAAYKASLAQLRQTKSQSAVSSNQSIYTRLLADRAGIVSEINAEPGQVVAPSQVIAKILDLKQLEVLVPMPESRVSQLKLGDMVDVKLWADVGHAYDGKVREIAPAANAKTRAFDIKVSIVNPDELVKVGMTAGVNFDVDATNKLIVPSTAVTAINKTPTVWVVNAKGIAKSKPVVIGDFTEDGVEILSGLSDGDVIAIAGVHTLVNGVQVKPQYETINRKY